MLAQLPTADPDPLWDLAREYLQDSRPEKMDLIVGVYRDEAGRTPVMRAVSVAESELSSRAPSKTYRGLSGNLHFIDGISRFLFGAGSSVLDRQCTIQTVGGTGALRLLAEFIAGVTPLSTVWVSNPGYVNHQPILAAAGIAVREFRWRENERGLDLDAALADLGQARPGDVLLIHGCCHNPSGIDPDPSQWRALSARCHQQEMIPFIDMAYQGFGRGVDEDAEGLRIMAAEHDCLLVAASCSKNMGLYCERTGAATIVAPDPTQLGKVRQMLERIARVTYSMPPDHGAAVAARLFRDPGAWLPELEACRLRIVGTRQQLADHLRAMGAPSTFQQLRHQKGMFSLLPLSRSQMTRLRNEFAVYGTTGGRINIAGVAPHQLVTLARAIAAVAESRP